MCGQVGDIEELLDPGYPVYMNYSGVPPHKAPPSLQVYIYTISLMSVHMYMFIYTQDPGRDFSIKGKLVEKNGMYLFGLFKYTHQVSQKLNLDITHCN